jgi:WD40 repeat protein
MDILDSVTLQQLQSLEFPQDVSKNTKALVFSPDSRILTCFSCEGKGHSDQELFVISWDLQTGGVASVVRWQAPEQSPVRVPYITYSANGKVVGILYWSHDAKTANISICDVSSGTHMGSHLLNGDILPLEDIWTHGESLQFATAVGTTITIWEVQFVSGGTPTKVETFPAPDNFDPVMFPHPDNHNPYEVEFFHAPCLIVLTIRGKVLVWDVQNSQYLLVYRDTNLGQAMTFSSDGCFFACSIPGNVYLWKKSPTGYILHETLQFGAQSLKQVFSWNGDLIAAFSDCTIKLWHTNSLTTHSSSISTQGPQTSGDFILDFSPDGTLAVATRDNTSTVMALNLKSGASQLTMSVDLYFHGLRVIRSTVVVVGCRGLVWKVIAWDLPAEGCVPDVRVGLEESLWTIDLENTSEILNSSQGGGRLANASISPGSCYIALTALTVLKFGCVQHLCIYSASTGECLGLGSTEKEYIPWFSPDGCDIWCAVESGEAEVWRVGEQNVLEHLEHTVSLENPPEGYPWASSQGYQVTDDWWILGPDGKRLLMLPPPWRSYTVQRMWKGHFLALLHEELLEPVILEVEP